VAEEIRERIQTVDEAVTHEEAALGLARELDDIAVNAFTSFDMKWSQQRKAVAEYKRLFARQGLDIRQPDKDWFASAIRSSPSRFALIAALDNWALLAGVIKDPQLARLLELARAVDPDPWRDRFRYPAVWADPEALTRLAKEVDVGRQSPTILVSLGWWLSMNREDPTALFERALLDHPRDFWLHLNAAWNVKEPGVKTGLALAALAIRPQSAVAYGILAYYLRERGEAPEALAAASRAIKISPNYALAHECLGLALRDKKQLPEAVAAFQRAIELDPGNSSPCWDLGNVLLLQGDGGAAAEAYRKAADRDGTAAAFRRVGASLPELKYRLVDLKDQPGAAATFQRAIELDPGDSLGCYILGQIFQLQGRYAEAKQAYLKIIKAHPACVPASDSLARLLATCPDDKFRDGKRVLDFATTACEQTSWKDPYYLDTLAAAYAEAGQFDEAVRYQTRARDDPALKGYLRTPAKRRLELYKQKKPFREGRQASFSGFELGEDP
jgi:tetratricopeptide (TPR) repeat protein